MTPEGDPLLGQAPADTVLDWKLHLNDSSDRPFSLVSQNLLSLRSLTIDQFLHAPDDDNNTFDITDDILEIIPRRASPTPPPEPPIVLPSSSEKHVPEPTNAQRMQIVARLHQTCQRVFGSTDALKFEFLEEDGPNSKQCILTIIRPNGTSRSYATQPVFARKNEAKANAAKLAIDMGAIDFIVSGDADSSKGKKGLVLAPLDTPSRVDSDMVPDGSTGNPPEVDDTSVQEIELCCMQWRAGLVKPQWFSLMDPKFGTKHGAALRIRLTSHSFRVYSSEPVFATAAEAKKACADEALRQGVVEYIKYGNGQTQPAVRFPSDEATGGAEDSAKPSTVAPLTLQSFYESLPQPFPEDFGKNCVTEINAPGWLNIIIQAARGCKFSIMYVWITDGAVGLHGCLLRLDRPDETKSYLVDAMFPKRNDAKAAVCLQALSQGVGNYIRGVAEAVELKVTPEMRKWANQQVFTVLGFEYQRTRPGVHLKYEFTKDRDAFGCSLKFELSRFPNADQVRTYTVPAEYRTKADAKIAVACQAAEAGAVEFLRFRGQPTPPGYTSFLSMRGQDVSSMNKSAKRKDSSQNDQLDPPARKKIKIDNETSGVPLLLTKEEAARQRSSLSRDGKGTNKVGNNNGKGNWKKPPVSGSSGRVPVTKPAQTGRSTGQHRSRPGFGGNSTTAYGAHPNPSFHGSHSAGSGFSHSPPPPQLGPGEHFTSYPLAPHAPPPHGGAYAPPGYAPYYGVPATAPIHPPPIYSPPPYVTPPYPSYSHPYQSQQPQPNMQYPHQYTQPIPQSIPSNHHSQPPNNDPPRQPPRGPRNATLPKKTHGQGPHSPQGPRRPSDDHESTRQRRKAKSTGGLPDPSKGKGTSSISDQRRKSVDVPPESATNSKVAVTAERKSYVTALLDYCHLEKKPQPKFHHDTVTNDKGKNVYKVWVVLGTERLELPVTFPTLTEGRERVAKQVLGRLRRSSGDKKEKDPE